LADPKERILTLLVIPDSAGVEVKRLRVPRRWVTLGLGATAGVFIFLVAVAIHDLYLLGERDDLRALRTENVELRAQVERLEDRVQGMAAAVERVQQFDAQLRRMTMLSDPERNLSVGPVGELKDSTPDPLTAASVGLKRDLLGDDNDRAVDLIRRRLEFLESETERAETSVRNLQVRLEDQDALLSSTPSLLPAKGWKTSDFGFRVDPYTGLQQMHNGRDISANIGTPVIATADGQVVWSGPQGAYGHVIMIDHGHSLTTLYAHLSELGAKVGESVKRGDLIGKVGNTGRSTGPHLHYEVRVGGVPQDPDRFILE
jgi:murein DD-endopeptidase MepM/ murein hydrolase activator NlpD